MPPPPRNKTLIRPIRGMMVLNNPLARPAISWGLALGGGPLRFPIKSVVCRFHCCHRCLWQEPMARSCVPLVVDGTSLCPAAQCCMSHGGALENMGEEVHENMRQQK